MRTMKVINTPITQKLSPFQKRCRSMHRCILLCGGSVKKIHTEYVLYKDPVTGDIVNYKNYTFEATLYGHKATGASPAGAASNLLDILGYEHSPFTADQQ